MKVDIVIGSIQSKPWSDLRSLYPNKNFLEFNESGLYQWWNNLEITYQELSNSNYNVNASTDLITERTWFRRLGERWATGTNIDLELIIDRSAKIQSAIEEYLAILEIKSCIGLYGIAHHIWNNIVEQAIFNKGGIQTVKIYPILDSGFSFLYSGCNEFNVPLFISNKSADLSLETEIKCALVDMKPKYTQRECSSGVKATEIWRCRIIFLKRIIWQIAKSLPRVRNNYPYDPMRSFAKRWKPRVYSDSAVIKSHREYLALYSKYSTTQYHQLDRGFIFYSQFEPEATTVPEGGVHYSTIDCIKLLRSKFPSVPIYYKEHPAIELAYDSNKQPTYVGIARNREYFDLLKEARCILLPLREKITLEQHRIYRLTPVSITGTIVLQAALNGISSMYFGHPWYKLFCNNLPAFYFDDIDEYADLFGNHADDLSTVFRGFVEKLSKYSLVNSLNIGLGSPSESADCNIIDIVYNSSRRHE